MQVSLTISSRYQGINSHHLEEIAALKEGQIVFVRESFIVKQMKNFKTKNAETVYLELIIAKKKWCVLFAYRPPDTNKTMFFNEIYITLNKILGKYDKVLLAGDLNIDEHKTGSGSSNHLFDAKDVFNLTNLRASFKKLPRKIQTYRDQKRFN